MDKKLLDLYTDYLLSSFSLVTATGLSELVDGAYSHDQVTRFLNKEPYAQTQYWRTIKPIVRRVETDVGLLLIDDTIEEKPYTDENDMVSYHYDHSQNRMVKGVNIVNFVYHTDLGDEESSTVAFELVTKTEEYTDKKTGKLKRRSKISKNEMVRSRLKILVQRNRIKLKYVLWDSWFSCQRVQLEVVKKDFVAAIKSNRTVALSEQDKREGVREVSDLDLAVGTPFGLPQGARFPRGVGQTSLYKQRWLYWHTVSGF